MGLAIRFRWLPSLVEEEDWATMAQLQERVQKEDERQEYEHWKQTVRSSW